MDNKIFYIGKPCKRCGGVERYKSNDLCPVCKAECNRRYKARKAREEGRKYRPREPLPPCKVKAVSRTENALKTMVKVLLGLFVSEKTNH